MALDFKSFFNKIRIKNASTSSKQLDLVVSDSSTVNTTTTVLANQTADRTLTLPDSSGTVVATSETLGTLSAVTTNAAGQLTTDSGISKSELQSLEGITGVVETRLSAAESELVSLDGRLDNVEANKANISLSNLTTTQINQSLIPNSTDSKDLGSAPNRWNAIYTKFLFANSSVSLGGSFFNITKGQQLPSGVTANTVGSTDIDTGIFTYNDTPAGAATATRNVRIETGNKTSGTGNSGDIKLQTGTSFGGSRGKIILDGLNIDMSARVVKNAADPVDVQDLATKNYVDLNSGTGGGANKTLSNLDSPVALNRNLTPTSNNTINIGSSSLVYNTTFSNTITSPNNFNIGIVSSGITFSSPGFKTEGLLNATIATAGATSSSNTGSIFIVSGSNSGSGASGDIVLRTGLANSSGNSGNISLTTSSTTTGKSGDIELNCYNATGVGGNGGAIYIRAGNGNNNGGNVTIKSGTGTSGSNGLIILDGVSTIKRLGSAPSSFDIGAIYYDDTLGKLRVYTALGWQTISST